MARIVPVLMIIFLLTYLLPTAWPVFEVMESILEGNVIFTFFKMLVGSVDGWETSIIILKESPGKCFNWSKNNPQSYLKTVYHAALQLVWFRPMCFIIKAILDAKNLDLEAARALTILAMMSMSFGMTFILTFYLILRDRIHHLSDPTKKFVFIKMLLILIIAENFIINSVTEVALSKLSIDVIYSSIQLRRVFAFVVLVELFVCACLYFHIFPLPPAEGSAEAGKELSSHIVTKAEEGDEVLMCGFDTGDVEEDYK